MITLLVFSMSKVSTIIARDNGALPFFLRLGSVVLATGSLISGYQSIGGVHYRESSPLIVIAGATILGWDLIYLIILIICIRGVPLPTTVTFDLASWLFALLWGTLWFIYNAPRMGQYLSAGFDGCSFSRELEACAIDKRVMKAMFATSVLLWTLT
jgi:hypothetical protein